MKSRIARICTEPLAVRPWTPLLRTFFTASQPAARSRFAQPRLQHGGLLFLRYQRSPLARRLRSWRFRSDKAPSQRPDPTPHLGSPEPALSLSQRLKQLSREYGWTAVGVYFALSVLDFPFCFLAVRLLGTDRIGHYEDVIKNTFWTVVRLAFPDAGRKAEAISTDAAEATAREGNVGAADAAMRSGADACRPLLCYLPLLSTYTCYSYLDAARSCIPRPQVLHFPSGTAYRRRSPQGCENTAILGLQHRKKEAQEDLDHTL
jgi:hypothetical protein